MGRAGTVYANDIDARSLAFLRDRCLAEQLTNVQTILGETEDALLPNGSLDMVMMVWVYHMLENPVPLLRSIGPSLKPGATLAILDPVPAEVEDEFRGARPGTRYTVPTREHVARDAGLAGFELADAKIGFLEKDNIFILRRK